MGGVTSAVHEAPAQQELVPRGEVKAVRVHQDTGPSQRIYELEFSDGVQTWREALWSVTTLLDILDKKGIPRWAARGVATEAIDQRRYLDADVTRFGRDAAIDRLAEAPYRVKSRAGDIGEAVHDLVEAHIRGSAAPTVEEALRGEVVPRFEQFLRWEEAFQPTYRGSEVTVLNLTYGYAGTLDMLIEIGTREGLGLIDVKNTNPAGRKKDRPGVWMEHALQCCAYANAERIVAARGAWLEPIPMPRIAWAAVLWLHPSRYALKEVQIDAQAQRAFLVAAELYRFTDGPGKKAVRDGELTPASFGILPTIEQQNDFLAKITPPVEHPQTPQEGAPVAPATAQDPADPTTEGPAGVGPGRESSGEPATITEAQRRALEAAARDAKIGHEGLKKVAAEVCDVTSTKLIPASDFDAVMVAVQASADPGPES